MSGTPGELTNTLILALSQSQDQVKTIRDQAVRIERLQKENARLKKELQDAEQQLHKDAIVRESSLQVDDLFQKHVEAQAEIRKLRRKFKQYKDKANSLLGMPLSSPSSRLSTSLPPSPKHATSPARFAEPITIDIPSSPPRKRPKVNMEVLHEITPNTLSSRSPSSNVTKKGITEGTVAAISVLSEDGEGYQQDQEPEDREQNTHQLQNSVYGRLDGLLAAPTPDKAPLSRPLSPNQSAISLTPSVPPRKLFNISNISNISHISSEPPATSELGRPGNSSTRESSSSNSANRHPQRAVAKLDAIRKRLPAARNSKRGRGDDDEPFRGRPLSRLSLQYFKPNPRWLDSHGVSYDEFLHGQNAKRINALVETLPQLPGQHEQGGPLTDDELLQDFLGPGSEDKIASLTELARANLLLEAKTKRVAKYFAKQRTDYDRDQDPPGFWSTDMPSTQENEENRRIAVEMEQAEIKKRYEEAVTGQGRWVFADE